MNYLLHVTGFLPETFLLRDPKHIFDRKRTDKNYFWGVRIVALSIGFHEQTQLNRVCCFLILQVLSISEGSVFQVI